MSAKKRITKLPQLLDTKIYKTGQTRGADDDLIFQNRVGRNSTVVIPFAIWDDVIAPPNGDDGYEKGFICLISPEEYFIGPSIEETLRARNLVLGENLLVFYQKRNDWREHPPLKGWSPANSRVAPLKGQYVARIAATTALNNGEKINLGFNTTGMKGAGIRLFEYASLEEIKKCRVQLEAAFWMCTDSMESVTSFGMTVEDATKRKQYSLEKAHKQYLLDFELLKTARIINDAHITVCPLCLEPLSAFGFFIRLAQALGREVHDLTVTEINLFHIKELQFGQFNHRPYNLGWGHHHCNVVVKDSGIDETLIWMRTVLKKNMESGFLKE
jgi:hypothetical protein